jgi:hypothetical protein
MKSAIYLILIPLFICSCIENPFRKKQVESDISPRIVGSWDLLILKGEDRQGHFQYPFDKDVKGFAFFDKNNNFSLQYFDASRPRMKNTDPFFSSDPEIRIAFLTGQSLYGKYRLFQDSIGMNIDASLNPNFSGTWEKRYYRIKGDTMLIIAPGRKVNGIFLKEYSIWLKSGK